MRINPRQQSAMNRNQSDQSELGLIQTEFSIKINPDHSDLEFILIENSVWIIPSWDWSGLIWIEKLVSDCCLGLIRIRSDRFFTVFHQTSYKTFLWIGPEWFALARIQISEWIGIVLIGSEWIPIRYFRQG